MSFFRAVSFIIACFGILCGVVIVIASIALWWPAVFFLLALIWYGWHLLKKVKREQHEQALLNYRKMESERIRQRQLEQGFNPDLPSALD